MDRALAQQVCDAVTILVAGGVMDYNGHASARVPAGGFMINTSASNRRGMTPEQVCHVDEAGKLLSGDRPPNEVHLHAGIYAARPEVQAVVHGHPKWTTLFTATGTPIPAVMPQGCLVADLPIYPSSHSVSSVARGREVAQALGQAPGILLSSHGSIFTGADLVEAVALAIYAEQNAERAYTARILGEAHPIGKAEADEYRIMLRKPNLFRKCWDYFLP